MNVLDSLIEIRKEKKIKQSDLLITLGITGTTLGKYERLERRIHLDEAIKYANYLGYEIRLIKK